MILSKNDILLSDSFVVYLDTCLIVYASVLPV